MGPSWTCAARSTLFSTHFLPPRPPHPSAGAEHRALHAAGCAVPLLPRAHRLAVHHRRLARPAVQGRGLPAAAGRLEARWVRRAQQRQRQRSEQPRHEQPGAEQPHQRRQPHQRQPAAEQPAVAIAAACAGAAGSPPRVKASAASDSPPVSRLVPPSCLALDRLQPKLLPPAGHGGYPGVRPSATQTVALQLFPVLACCSAMPHPACCTSEICSTLLNLHTLLRLPLFPCTRPACCLPHHMSCAVAFLHAPQPGSGRISTGLLQCNFCASSGSLL